MISPSAAVEAVEGRHLQPGEQQTILILRHHCSLRWYIIKCSLKDPLAETRAGNSLSTWSQNQSTCNARCKVNYFASRASLCNFRARAGIARGLMAEGLAWGIKTSGVVFIHFWSTCRRVFTKRYCWATIKGERALERLHLIHFDQLDSKLCYQSTS